MLHEMRLLEEPFELIKAGKKIIEIRLNDEKRQRVKIGDEIVFYKLPDCKEAIKVKVLGLLHYCSFEQFYKDTPFSYFGREDYSMEKMLEETYKIYTVEEEKKYGVLGIRIELVEL